MQINPNKTRGVRQLGNVDLGALAGQILSIPQEVWDIEDAGKPNRFETLERTQHIVFRFVQSVQDWRQSYDRPIWSQWQGRIEPLLRLVTEVYGYRNGGFPRVMLARMAPGGVIKPHVDAGPAARWPHKIHIPIQTNEQVRFFIDPNTYHFPVGAAVEVNNLGVHAVRNDGDTSRIHLIFEYCDYAGV